MHNLSYLEKLLDGVEVEWKRLGDIGHIVTGRTPKSSDKSAWGDEVDFVTPSDIKNGMRSITCPSRRLSAEGASSMTKAQIPSGSLLVTCIGADMGKTVINANDCITNQQINAIISTDDSVQIGYLFHVLTAMRDTLRRQGELGGGTMPLINKSDFSKIIVPIPCPNNTEKSLAIQAEIVRILDAFTIMTAELTTELTAELTMRKKQYKYYRDQLLSFEEVEVEHLQMGHEKIGEFIRGGSLQKKDFTEAGVGCIHYGQIYTHYGTYATETKTCISEELAKKCRKAQTGNLVIATTSENDEDVCKAVAWLGKEDIAVSSDACIYKHKLNPKFVSYFFQTEQFQAQKRKFITGAKVRRVNADSLAKISIPVPSPKEQARIVAILDKFDALTLSIQEGLRQEIELRQKQYEYYRDLLLSFAKSVEETA